MTATRDDGILRLRERGRLFADWMARLGAAPWWRGPTATFSAWRTTATD